MRQWSKLFLCSFLVFWNTASSQNVTSDMTENDRQIRETKQDCCPCPGSPASPMGRAGELECPCLPRTADAEASPSLLTPSVIRLSSRKNEKKEDPKPLLHPEVNFASSVLETLREATDEEYKEAVARDAQRSLAELDKSRDISEKGSKKVVTITVNSKERNSPDDVVAEASQVQETRVHPHNGFSHHPLQTQHKAEQKDTNKKIFDDINRKSVFDNNKAELKITHNNYMTPKNALTLSKNSFNDPRTNEENTKSLNNIDNDCTENTPQTLSNLELRSNSDQNGPNVMQSLHNDIFKTQPIAKITVNDPPNEADSNKQDTPSENSQNNDSQNNNLIPPLKKSLIDLQNFFNSRNVELFDPIKLATQLRDATKKNILGLKRIPYSPLKKLDPFLKSNVNDDSNMNESDANNMNFTQKRNNKFDTQKDPEPSASEQRPVTELRRNSDQADFMVDFNTGHSRPENIDSEIKYTTTDDEDDVEYKSSEQEDCKNNKSNAKFLSDRSVHDADISDERSDLESILGEEERKENGEENFKDSVSLSDLQKLSDSLLNESSIKESENSEKVKCGIEMIGDINTRNIYSRESAKSFSHEEEETENKGILRDLTDMGTHEKTCSTDMLMKNSDSQEMKVEASNPVANKLALPSLIFPNDDIIGSLHNIIVEPSSLFNTPQFNLFKRPPIFTVNDILNQPLPSLDELRFRISDILGTEGRRSSEIDFDVGNSNINPIVSELSKNTRKLNPLRNPSRDTDFDFIQLRPLSLSQPHQLKSKLPRYNFNSYKAKLSVPKSLEIKPLKLESTFEKEGGLLDARLNFGPDLIKTAKKTARKLSSKQDFLKERGQSQFDRFEQMRKDSRVFGIDTPLWPDEPLNTASKNFQSRAEKSMRKIQQTLDSSHKERHTNDYNLFSDTLLRPQNLLTKTLPIHNNIQEKLQSLHADLNDRLSSLQRSIIEEPKWPILVNPTSNKNNRRSKNAKSYTAKTNTPSLLTREYQNNIVNRPSKVAKPIPHILRNKNLGSLKPRYTKELRTAASSLSPEIIDIQSFKPISSKSGNDSETRNTLKEYDSKTLHMNYNTKIRRLLELIRKSRMDKLKSVIKPLGLSDVEVLFSTTLRPTTDKNDIFNSASLQRSTSLLYSKPKDKFTLGSKAISVEDTSVSPSKHVKIEAPFIDNLGGLRATEENPDTEFNGSQRPSTVETDKIIETPLDEITAQSSTQKLKVTNCEKMKNTDYRTEADTNVPSFRKSESRVKLPLNVENNNNKLHLQPFVGLGKSDYNKLRNVPIVKEEETPLLSKLWANKTKKTTRDSDADTELSSSEVVQGRFDKLTPVTNESSDTVSFKTGPKLLPLKNDKVTQNYSNYNKSPSIPPSLTNTKCKPVALVYKLNNSDFTLGDRNDPSSELIDSITPFDLNKLRSIGEEENYAKSTVDRMEKPSKIIGTPQKKNKSLLARLRDAKKKMNSAANSDTDLTWSPSNTVEARFNNFRTSSEDTSDKGPEIGRLKPPALKKSKGPQTQLNVNTSRSKHPTLKNTNFEDTSKTDFTGGADPVEEYGTDDFKNEHISTKASSLNFSDELRAADENHNAARNIILPTLKNDKVSKTLKMTTSQSRPPTLTATDCEDMKDTDYMRGANPNPPTSEKDLSITNRRLNPETLIARMSYEPLKSVVSQRRKNSLLPMLKDEGRKVNLAVNPDTDLTWSPSDTVEARFNKFRTSSEESSEKGSEIDRLKPPTLKNLKGPQTRSNMNTSRSKPPTLKNTNCEGMSETDFPRGADTVEEYSTDDFTNEQMSTETSSLNFSEELRAEDENHNTVQNIRPLTVKNDKVSKTLDVTTSQSRSPTLTVTDCEGLQDTDYRS